MSKAEKINVKYFEDQQSFYGIIKAAKFHPRLIGLRRYEVTLSEDTDTDIPEGKEHLYIRVIDGYRMLRVTALVEECAGPCEVGNFVEVIYDGCLKGQKQIFPHFLVIDHSYFNSLGDDWNGDYF